jgi:hypothetical protein
VLDCVGLDWVVLDFVGLRWIRLGWVAYYVGMGWVHYVLLLPRPKCIDN